jgi:polyferredoxin
MSLPKRINDLGTIMEAELKPAFDRIRATPPRPAARKKLVRRAEPDWSQPLRRGVQILFVVLNACIAFEFWRFVRHFEAGTPAAPRPAGVEGWLPIAGLMNLKYFFLTGRISPIHPAAMFLLVSFLLISIIFRKAFCGWLCPIGTLCEALWKLGRKVTGRNWTLPRPLDLVLRGLKYVLLGFFLYAVAGLSAESIAAFLGSPYGLVADVKMLNFFRHLSGTAAVTLAVLAVLSVVYQNFWCRYLCPYGALTGIASLLSPTRIRREPDQCIDCARCARACPALLPVDKLMTVRSAECMSCLECVAACPAQGALQMSIRKRTVPAWVLAVGIALVFGAVVGYAKWAGLWESHIPASLYNELVTRANEFVHPGM